MSILIQFLFLYSSLYTETVTYSISVEINNLPSNQGQVIISLHNDSETFPKKYFVRKTAKILNGSTQIVIFDNLKKGNYAITAIHDKNNNGKLDFNFLHIPSEKTCASKGAKGFMGPPKYKDAKFELENNLNVSLSF